MMEKLTQDLADEAWKIIEEVDSMGGMTHAVESGWAKMKIEGCAADKQARIDSARTSSSGVNKYKLAKQDDPRNPRHRQQRRPRLADRPPEERPRRSG
nr:methylmalonyl-CoA mutase family protein [Candidatus Accumulibacter sp. ACC007]